MYSSGVAIAVAPSNNTGASPLKMPTTDAGETSVESVDHGL